MYSLSKSQQTLLEKARNSGSSEMGVALNDLACWFLVSIIARDLGQQALFPEIDFATLPRYFDAPLHPPQTTKPSPQNQLPLLLARLFHHCEDADTYFSCLATLHKSRLKYQQILKRQPFPTFEQIGLRGLLQYGILPAHDLMSWLSWRKWFYDLDNRAAQDTGYLFEPILAHSIGGTPMSASKSPIKRRSDKKKGRQADCIRQAKAYEFKLRVTIAASGQGRWNEELDFPLDCQASGYTPVLIVLDPTPNPKLEELKQAFLQAHGEVFIGETAWKHLEEEAGASMSIFLENYIRQPLDELLIASSQPLLGLGATYAEDCVHLKIGEQVHIITRLQTEPEEEAHTLPSDINDELPGL